MCVALPGRVLAVNGPTAELDFSGNRVTARVGAGTGQSGAIGPWCTPGA